MLQRGKNFFQFTAQFLKTGLRTPRASGDAGSPILSERAARSPGSNLNTEPDAGPGNIQKIPNTP